MFKRLPMYQNIGESAYKKDLSNIKLICNHLNNPQDNFKSIHIGGTNGKGSCSHMLSSILQQAGLKVGLYTSPHLVDFRERIRINGRMISKKFVEDFMNGNLDFFESNNLSFFEMTVGMAFHYFSNENVDIAIIEVGMGGRLDSTNIINPELSIITNISLDHTNFLGDNIIDIAKEKAGIIKKNIPVVIGESQNEIDNIFKEISKLNGSDIYFANEYTFSNYDCDLKGNYQKKNITTVLKSVQLLNNIGYEVNNIHLHNGLKNIVKNTGLQGRWQVIQNKPLIICDTAHNEAALKEVISQLINLDYSNLHMIIGFSDDKDLDKIAKLFPENSKYYFVKPKVDRGKDSQEVKQIFQSYNKTGTIHKSVPEAISHIKKTCSQEDVIFIGGSTFVVSEIFEQNYPSKI